MKKIFVQLFAFLLPLLGFAQYYHPIITHSASYFEYNNNTYTLAIRDSQDGRFSFLPSPLPNLYSTEAPCIGSGLFSIAGKYMVQQGDTAFLFYNLIDTAITLLTNTAVGSSWLGYDDANVSITFYHVSDSCIVIKGQRDSIQVIEPRPFVKVLHEVSGNDYGNFKPIWLSKHHGLIAFPNLYNFPYLNILMYGEDLPLPDYLKEAPAHIHNITWDSIYHIEPGEEFHTVSYFYSEPLLSSGTKSWDSISNIFEVYDTERFGNDSLKLSGLQYRRLHSMNNGIISSQETIDTIDVLIIRRSFLDLPPGITYPSNVSSTLTIKPDIALLTKRYYITYGAFGDDSCIHLLHDWYPPRDEYINGLGGPYYRDSNRDITYWSKGNVLVFAKKKHYQIGTPLPKRTGVDTRKLTHEIWHISPNPVTDVLYIKHTPHQSYHVIITDLLGRERIQQFNSTANQINVSALEAGFYYISFETPDGGYGYRSFIKY